MQPKAQPPLLSAGEPKEAPPSSEFQLDDLFLKKIVPALRKIARFGYGVPEQDVEDLIQESLLQFLIESGRRPQVGSGLLVVIARRRCLEYWRERFKNFRHEAEFSTLTEAEIGQHIVEGDRYTEGVSDGLRLARIWPSLSAQCRKALARRFWNNEKTADIAVGWGYEPDTVKRIISRCLSRLREKIEEAS
jgi:RNA polymerase sigma factor (sigma-70 family)